MAKQGKQYKRIVAKFGTNLLTNGTDSIDMNVLTGIVKQAAELHKEGKEIILVSSGAVASGRQLLSLEIQRLLKQGKTELDSETLKALNQVALYALMEIRNDLAHKAQNPNILRNLDELIAKHRKDVPTRQVMAAVGQHVLMNYYSGLFLQHNIFIAQALLTKLDLANRVSYLNARNTLLALLEAGVVPIINENDVVATDELEGAHFGDNDNLSGMVANLIDADLLVIMSDVAGLYTADPALDKNAKLIPVVKKIDKSIEKMAGGTRGRGTGGMTTKIQAARLATASGTAVVIASGSEPDLLPRLVKGESVGTMFLPASDKVESRKRWILSGLATKGRLTVDGGAAAALSKGNKSLLPAGVNGVEGGFKRGDAVDILNEAGERIACGISNYAAADVEKIKGARSDKIEKLLGHGYGDEVVHRDNIVVL